MQIKLYKTLARSVLIHRSEARTLWKYDVRSVTTSEMQFMHQTVGFTRWDQKRNEDILKNLQVVPVLAYIYDYQKTWQKHIHRMPRTRIPKAIMQYQPRGKRSLGRLQWRTVT